MSEVSRPEAIHNAAHDLAVQRAAQEPQVATRADSLPLSESEAAELNREHPEVFNDAAHPAITQTGVGDNRDETGDPEKAAAMGAIGGAVVGAAAGSMLGPVGTVVGAIGGALTAGGVAGLAVDVVDQNDNDNTISGLDDGTIRIPETDVSSSTARPAAPRTDDNNAPIV
jgi:outer membrane lipoprotein SlyB